MQRNAGLDAMRLLAFFLVMGRHLHLPPGEPNFVLGLLQKGGWVGIDIFFVLSGFLVSGTLFRELLKNGRVGIGNFLVRRAVKIYPAFYGFLVISLVVAYSTNAPLASTSLLGEVFFLQNYLGNIFGHTWSLAVEEHFYLALAALFWIVQKWNKAPGGKPFWILPIFIVVAIFCLASRSLSEASGYETHNRMDALFFGVLLSYLAHYTGLLTQLQKIPALLLVCTGAILLIPPFIFPSQKMITLGLTGNYLGAGLMILGAIRMSSCRSLSVLAEASYSMYLWHMSANALAQIFFPAPESYALYVFSYLALSLGIGYTMYLLIEKPVSVFFKRRQHRIPFKVV